MLWDNAYAVHHLTDVETPALDVLAMAAEAGIRTEYSSSPRRPRSLRWRRSLVLRELALQR